MADPQVLIDKAAQVALLGQLEQAGHNGALLLEQARVSLVSSIHLGLVVAAAAAALGVWCARQVPSITLTRAPAPAMAAD